VRPHERFLVPTWGNFLQAGLPVLFRRSEIWPEGFMAIER
jgi:hypothetical protein